LDGRNVFYLPQDSYAIPSSNWSRGDGRKGGKKPEIRAMDAPLMRRKRGEKKWVAYLERRVTIMAGCTTEEEKALEMRKVKRVRKIERIEPEHNKTSGASILTFMRDWGGWGKNGKPDVGGEKVGNEK